MGVIEHIKQMDAVREIYKNGITNGEHLADDMEVLDRVAIALYAADRAGETDGGPERAAEWALARAAFFVKKRREVIDYL